MSDTKFTSDNSKESCHDEPRTRNSSDRAVDEAYKSEEIHMLFKRRAGYMGVLTKIYKNISELITRWKCNVGDVSLQLDKFDKAWCEFVGVHEKYLGLLQNETDKQIACASYEEQSQKKMSLDALATEWRQSAKLKSHGKSVTGSRSARSKHLKGVRSRSFLV